MKTKACRDHYENIERKLLSRNNHVRVTCIITVRRCLEWFCVLPAICCHSMVLAAVVCLYLLFVTICSLVLCHLLLFWAVCWCMVLFAMICRYWLQIASIYLLPFPTVCCYLQLFAAFCNNPPRPLASGRVDPRLLNPYPQSLGKGLPFPYPTSEDFPLCLNSEL